MVRIDAREGGAEVDGPEMQRTDRAPLRRARQITNRGVPGVVAPEQHVPALQRDVRDLVRHEPLVAEMELRDLEERVPEIAVAEERELAAAADDEAVVLAERQPRAASDGVADAALEPVLAERNGAGVDDAHDRRLLVAEADVAVREPDVADGAVLVPAARLRERGMEARLGDVGGVDVLRAGRPGRHEHGRDRESQRRAPHDSSLTSAA